MSGLYPIWIPVKNILLKKKWTYYAAAAIVFLCLISSLYVFQYHFNQSQTNAYLTQPAEKKTIKLADGTLVKLNAASKLEIADGFGKTNRAVKLVGEAYMEVAKNKALPFTVTTQALQVRVLGTTINVRAYANEELTAASLIEGSAEVILKSRSQAPIRLKPKDKVVAPLAEAQPSSKNNTTGIEKNPITNWRPLHSMMLSNDWPKPLGPTRNLSLLTNRCLQLLKR
ncbi:FecR family protein [Sphingobacterium sp. E70]|uniref:FecR family protein n=1 Tax=Sphingobacterium sp. E70 TaxID=2853439 RepID=UPI00211CBF5F|nr:FecR family protein [Sphingobacterium sp. E70]ULT23757.1 FecR family protein [Sphingobacterium sp. E70]